MDVVDECLKAGLAPDRLVGGGKILGLPGQQYQLAALPVGADLLKDFAEKCAEIANMDKSPKLEGRNMSMFLSPKPVTPAKKPAKPKQPKQTVSSPADAPAEVSPADAE